MTRRAALVAVFALMSAGRASARVYLTMQQALDSVFPPPTTVERKTLYLDEAQARRVSEAAGAPVDIRVVPYYVGARDGRVAGYAYFDTHLVRTLPETILVLVGPAGDVARIEILSFDEPEDYLPSQRWLRQFAGRMPASLGGREGIRALTGATLSSRAVTQAVRRILALHHMYVATPAASPSPRPTPRPAP
ncbi:MAG: hypothetical protein AUH92_03180 [Acidobacteria bacterium 13_1_40CM_4_69_4]|nr:MAG: hypothetical protein AUH92_03180 [Acidobacteria bacterium 13_1_40CM_4_69_4]